MSPSRGPEDPSSPAQWTHAPEAQPPAGLDATGSRRVTSSPSAAATSPQLTLAGWGRRAGAQIIDGLIVGIGAVLLFAAVTASFSVGFFAGEEIGIVSIVLGLLLAVVCVSVVALLYAPAMMGRTNGRTLGRMATGIRVVRADGLPITFGFALVREVAVKVLLFGVLGSITAGIAYLLDYLWPLWDDENRALHDFVVDTRTILD